MELEKENNLYKNIKKLLENARKQVLTTVNSLMTLTYYEIGRQIVEEEQNGENRAKYGKKLIKTLFEKLTKEFGKSFGVRNIEIMRKFYIVFSDDEKTKSLIAKSINPFELSWTHYIRLMRIKDIKERKFYEIESKQENWTVREMERQIDSCLYQRLELSRYWQVSILWYYLQKRTLRDSCGGHKGCAWVVTYLSRKAIYNYVLNE